MPSDAWWEAQRRLHDRLERASQIEDENERWDAKKKAWETYNSEKEGH